MRIERNQVFAVLSEALDSVEKEVFGASDYHAKRVALLCFWMGRQLEMREEELADLTAAALMHDNALREYQSDYEDGKLKQGVSGRAHCAAGEKNIQMLPGCGAMRGFVQYHHECANGSGPFGKKEPDTPFGAQLIHIADDVDVKFSLGRLGAEKLADINSYLLENEGSLFGKQACDCMRRVLSDESLSELSDEKTEHMEQKLPPVWVETSGDEKIYAMADLFARIIDYKSPFTGRHSAGVAEKARSMAEYYGFDKETTAKLYLAGALHDIGKLLVDRDILEKPGRLDEKEYKHMQAHAYETWRLLRKIPGLEDVTEWASHHHEKLNGTGYPFGKTAAQLSDKERLLACLDIFQALTEDRPYKAGMSKGKAISILEEMAEKGELDAAVTADLAVVFEIGEEESDAGQKALFQCPVCGYIYEGDVILDGYCCPVCGQPDTAFVRIL